MPYIQELRAVVGSRPLILVAAGVLICNAAGELLLQRRTDDQLWGIPGGSMELGESAEETARREVWEETGLLVGELRLFAVFSGAEMEQTFPNGDQAAIVSVMYLAAPAATVPYTSLNSPLRTTTGQVSAEHICLRLDHWHAD